MALFDASSLLFFAGIFSLGVFTASLPGPTISCNATVVSHLDFVQVEFSQVAEADRDGCWLGVFVVGSDLNAVLPNPTGSTYGDTPFTANAPLKWMLCTDADPAFAASGSGTKAFRLLNVRTPVFFALLTGGSTAPVAVAQTPAISFNAVAAPHQVHVALTETPSALLVQWTSASSDAQEVVWGPQPGVTTATQASAVDTFTAEDLCGAPANKEGWLAPGFFHSARILDLQPGQIVFYRVGSDTAGWSAYFQVRGPSGAAVGTNVRILLTADVGATEPDGASTQGSHPLAFIESFSGTTLSRLASAVSPDLVLHVGDLAYADGYGGKWELFMEEVQGVASQTPYLTTMGNHELDWTNTGSLGKEDSGGECGVPMQHRFLMPIATGQQTNGFYSFEMGPVHFAVMLTELPCGVGTAQYEFLEQDFAAVNRTATPWLVVVGHRPMYGIQAKGSVGPDTTVNFCDGGNGLEMLMYTNQVNLAIWGHVHNTIATCPVFNGVCGKAATGGGFAGTVHAVIGNGGQALDGLPHKIPDWVAYSGSTWGWNYLAATANHLHLHFIDDATNATNYELVITN